MNVERLEAQLETLRDEARDQGKTLHTLDTRFKDFKEWHRGYLTEMTRSLDKLEESIRGLQDRFFKEIECLRATQHTHTQKINALEKSSGNLKGRLVVLGVLGLVFLQIASTAAIRWLIP